MISRKAAGELSPLRWSQIAQRFVALRKLRSFPLGCVGQNGPVVFASLHKHASRLASYQATMTEESGTCWSSCHSTALQTAVCVRVALV